MDPSLIEREIQRRRTFAIISHPDAGKTTLTEKLLLYGGAIHLAGAVKAKRGRAAALSDWMEMERERGISITTSVMQFPYRGLQMNLLDTHWPRWPSTSPPATPAPPRARSSFAVNWNNSCR